VKRAVVVADGRLQVDAVMGALGAAGFEAVAVSSVGEIGSYVELGAVAVILGLAAEGLEAGQSAALASMPSSLRRSCVAALVGPGLTTWDGTKAFFLGVDVVVAAPDVPRLGDLVAAALASKKTLVAPLDPNAAGKLGG
jgi:hypothetical protein